MWPVNRNLALPFLLYGQQLFYMKEISEGKHIISSKVCTNCENELVNTLSFCFIASNIYNLPNF